MVIRLKASKLCATRALKNLKYIQKVAPQVVSANDARNPYAFAPYRELSDLHRPERRDQKTKLGQLVRGIEFPKVNKTAKDPLFNGTLFFARIQFTIQNQGNAVLSVNNADLRTAVTFARLAASAISHYASAYGTNRVAVSRNILAFQVTLATNNFADSDLAGWVNTIAVQNNLPSNSCIVVLSPQGVVNSFCDPSTGCGGYHGFASIPYIYVNANGTGFTIADQQGLYALALSHEIAEMVVDPTVDFVNPEVCDPCGPNCQTVYIDYFGPNRTYIATSQTFPPAFSYTFLINAIVQPASASNCPASQSACVYAPPAGPNFTDLSYLKPLLLSS